MPVQPHQNSPQYTVAPVVIKPVEKEPVQFPARLYPANAKAATRNDVNNLGGSVGLLVQSPSDASVAEIPQGDLDTAKLFGKRVADIAARFKA